MRVRKHGKCKSCKRQCSEEAVFSDNVDMFNPNPDTRIRGKLAEELKAWRRKPMFCDYHKVK